MYYEYQFQLLTYQVNLRHCPSLTSCCNKHVAPAMQCIEQPASGAPRGARWPVRQGIHARQNAPDWASQWIQALPKMYSLITHSLFSA